MVNIRRAVFEVLCLSSHNKYFSLFFSLFGSWCFFSTTPSCAQILGAYCAQESLLMALGKCYQGWGWGPGHPVVHRIYSSLCSQGSLWQGLRNMWSVEDQGRRCEKPAISPLCYGSNPGFSLMLVEWLLLSTNSLRLDWMTQVDSFHYYSQLIIKDVLILSSNLREQKKRNVQVLNTWTCRSFASISWFCGTFWVSRLTPAFTRSRA